MSGKLTIDEALEICAVDNDYAAGVLRDEIERLRAEVAKNESLAGAFIREQTARECAATCDALPRLIKSAKKTLDVYVDAAYQRGINDCIRAIRDRFGLGID